MEKIYKHIGAEHYNPIQVHPEYLAIMPPSGNKPTVDGIVIQFVSGIRMQ